MTFSMDVDCEDVEGGTWDGESRIFEAVDLDAAETIAIEEAAMWLQHDDSGVVAERVTIELSDSEVDLIETIEVAGEQAEDVTIYQLAAQETQP